MTPDWSATPEAVPSADPGDPQTLNLYAYAGNNPVTRSDADGHTPLDWIWKSAGHMMQEVGFAFHLWTGPNAGGCTTARCTVTVMAKPAAASTVALVDPRTTWALVRNDIRLWWASRGCHPGQLCGGTVFPEGELELGAAESISASSDEIQAILSRAALATGNESVQVGSRAAAESAAEQFLGTESRDITQKFGNRAGQKIGRISADGMRVVRDDGDHFNFENKLTGGNLHVYFGGHE